MEGCEICTLSPSVDGHRSHVSIFLLKKVIIKRRIILDILFPNQPLGVKWKVCDSCTLSHSMDGHRSHVSIFLLTKVITKRRIILDMQFPNQPLGVNGRL